MIVSFLRHKDLFIEDPDDARLRFKEISSYLSNTYATDVENKIDFECILRRTRSSDLEVAKVRLVVYPFFDQALLGGAWSLLRVSGVGVSAFNFCCGISTDSASAFVVFISSS